jgi:hypothetical protein
VVRLAVVDPSGDGGSRDRTTATGAAEGSERDRKMQWASERPPKVRSSCSPSRPPGGAASFPA